MEDTKAAVSLKSLPQQERKPKVTSLDFPEQSKFLGQLESVLFPAIAAFYIIQEKGFGTVVNFRPETCKFSLFSESPLQMGMFQYVVNCYTADREFTLYAIQYGSLFNNLEEKLPKVMQCKIIIRVNLLNLFCRELSEILKQIIEGHDDWNL